MVLFARIDEIDLLLTKQFDIRSQVMEENPKAQIYLNNRKWKENVEKAHVTLAHKRAHGVAAVAAYGWLRASSAPVLVTALLFTDKLCALEIELNAGEGQTIKSHNSWPHITVSASSYFDC
jgi:hypothetical protein